MNFEITKQADGSYLFTTEQPFAFENGQTIKPLELVYETVGRLNKAKSNAIVIHHALSTHAHVCSHKKNPTKGWWEAMVGPSKAIDTDQFFVICINNLGSCFGSSGPASVNPLTNQPYRCDFPALTVADMVRSQHLLLSCLGIKQVHAIIGNSMGAMLSLTWALLFPNNVKQLISVSSCYRTYPVTLAYHDIQKEIVKLDPDWRNGYYQENPLHGLKLARKLGLLSYRDPADLNERFDKEHDVRDYLDYNAKKISKHFDTNSYLYLVEAMDNFDVTKNYNHKVDAFKPLRAKTLILAVDSDILYPPSQQEELYRLILSASGNVSFELIHSHYGHDAFYVDRNIGRKIRAFLHAESIC